MKSPVKHLIIPELVIVALACVAGQATFWLGYEPNYAYGVSFLVGALGGTLYLAFYAVYIDEFSF